MRFPWASRSSSRTSQQDKTQAGYDRRDFLRTALWGVGAAASVTLPAGCAGESHFVSTPNSIPSASAWKFGIIADSQWYQPDDGENPYSVAVGILSQMQQQLIANGVDFVVQVGDLTSNAENGGSNLDDVAARALFAQALYNAKVGFFPIRGNHEDNAGTASVFQSSFPQTQNGVMNNSPESVLSLANPDTAKLGAQSNTLGTSFTQGQNFSSPGIWSGALKGLSYSFDYKNVRFLLLDQFTPGSGWPSGVSKDTSVSYQQSWIDKQLSGHSADSHVLVFSHKGLITPYHYDGLHGENPGQNGANTDAFMQSLAENNVHYLICGHDHMHDRSVVRSTGTNGALVSVNQLVASSASCYNYYPRTGASSDPSSDSYNQAAFSFSRRSPIAQELNTFGFYIVTVDGDNLTFDFYSGPSYAQMDASQHQWDLSSTPTINFTHRESFGYSLNGKQFSIPYAASFTEITDTSANGTVLKVLSGSNIGQGQDYSGQALVRQVNTGWVAASGSQASDVLYLWGLHSAIGSKQCEPYTLQLSYDPKKASGKSLQAGSFGIAALDDSGVWSNAVKSNSSGQANFVQGAWQSGYGLGSWGVDTANHVVWAVLNYDGIFVVSNNLSV